MFLSYRSADSAIAIVKRNIYRLLNILILFVLGTVGFLLFCPPFLFDLGTIRSLLLQFPLSNCQICQRYSSTYWNKSNGVLCYTLLVLIEKGT